MNITLQDAMSLKTPEGNASFLDIRFAVLNNLSQGWYSYDMMTAADGEITGVGSVIYRVLHLPQAVEYKGTISTQNVVIDTVEVKIDDKRSIGYEIEDMDLAQIIAAPSVQAQQAKNVAEAIKADKNAHLFIKLNAEFKANPERTMYLPELVQEGDMREEEYRSLQKKILVKRTKLANIINKKYINVNATEFFGLIAPIAHTNFEMLLTTLNISSAAFNLIQFGIGGMGNGGTVATLGGTPFISDPFIGQKIARGDSFNGDYDMDNSEYAGYLLHRTSIAYPSKWGKMQILPNPANLNTMVKAKWFTGFGVLRPELMCAFVTKFFTNIEDEITLGVGEEKELKHSDVGSKNFDVKVVDEQVVSFENGKLVAKGQGNTTVDFNVDGETVKTVTVNVK